MATTMLPSRVREDMWLQGQTHVKQRAEETQPKRKRIHVPYTEHVRHTEVPRWVFGPQKVDDYSGGKNTPSWAECQERNHEVGRARDR